MLSEARIPIKKISEKRRFRRVELATPLLGKVLTWKVEIPELSLHGARITLETALPRGRHVDLEFRLEGISLMIPCEIVRCTLIRRGGSTAYSSGLRFCMDPSERPMRIVRAYLAALVRRDVIKPSRQQAAAQV